MTGATKSTMPRNERAALGTVDTAAYIGTTTGALRLSRHTGELYSGIATPKYIKAGPRKVLYLRADLDDWLDELPRYELIKA
jgi:hypothetical protein